MGSISQFSACVDRYEPSRDRPKSGKCSKNNREDQSCLEQSCAWGASVEDRIDCPSERVADVGEDTIDQWAEDHHDRLFKIFTRPYCSGTSREYKNPGHDTN